MKSMVFFLFLAAAAVAQYASDAGVSDGGAYASSSTGSSPIPAPTTYHSSLYTGLGAPPAAPTAAPTDFYQYMPYSSFQSGGYQSLDCGYGYSKQDDGSCSSDSWVRLLIFS